MYLYKSLYTILDLIPGTERTSFVSDLRELGLRDAYQARERHRATQCPVYRVAGPEIKEYRTGYRELPRWIL